jgi:hypothetical protein
MPWQYTAFLVALQYCIRVIETESAMKVKGGLSKMESFMKRRALWRVIGCATPFC